MQYADLAEWQNELLAAEDTQAGREFWRSRAHELRRESHLSFERKGGAEAPSDPARETCSSRPSACATSSNPSSVEHETTARSLPPHMLARSCYGD